MIRTHKHTKKKKKKLKLKIENKKRKQTPSSCIRSNEPSARICGYGPVNPIFSFTPLYLHKLTKTSKGEPNIQANKKHGCGCSQNFTNPLFPFLTTNTYRTEERDHEIREIQTLAIQIRPILVLVEEVFRGETTDSPSRVTSKSEEKEKKRTQNTREDTKRTTSSPHKRSHQYTHTNTRTHTHTETRHRSSARLLGTFHRWRG